MCNKCGNTGLLPFEKSGKVIPNAFVHCSCHPTYGDNPEPERYYPLKPEDFDFPCSASFRGYYQQLCGQLDQQISVLPVTESEPLARRVIYEHTEVSDKAMKELTRLGDIVKKLASPRATLKKIKPTNYKGLAV